MNFDSITFEETKKMIKDSFNLENNLDSLVKNMEKNASAMHAKIDEIKDKKIKEKIIIIKCRKKILNEINLLLQEIAQQKNNEFNFTHKNDELLPKNVILYKSCIITLYSMSEFIDNSDIFDQFNPLDIANMVYSKEYNIVKNLIHILKNMKIDEKNELFHEMGII